MPIIRVSQKGQLVIPAYLRRKYGIQAPGRAMIAENDGKIVIAPAPSDPVSGGRGMLKAEKRLAETHDAYKREESELEEIHERNLP